jgi:hypothetical protein
MSNKNKGPNMSEKDGKGLRILVPDPNYNNFFLSLGCFMKKKTNHVIIKYMNNNTGPQSHCLGDS